MTNLIIKQKSFKTSSKKKIWNIEQCVLDINTIILSLDTFYTYHSEHWLRQGRYEKMGLHIVAGWGSNPPGNIQCMRLTMIIIISKGDYC